MHFAHNVQVHLKQTHIYSIGACILSELFCILNHKETHIGHIIIKEHKTQPISELYYRILPN